MRNDSCSGSEVVCVSDFTFDEHTRIHSRYRSERLNTGGSGFHNGLVFSSLTNCEVRVNEAMTRIEAAHLFYQYVSSKPVTSRIMKLDIHIASTSATMPAVTLLSQRILCLFAGRFRLLGLPGVLLAILHDTYLTMLGM